jgi:DNA-directed RNA polymerase II subunit RPB11
MADTSSSFWERAKRRSHGLKTAVGFALDCNASCSIPTGVPNTSIFTFNKEDHTLGNLLSSRLRTKDHVTFSGYVVGHPLVPKFELRVGTDGSMTPKDAIIQVCKEILMDLDMVSREFTKEMELFKIAHPETMADDSRGA